MKIRSLAVLALALSACSPADKRQTQEEAHRAGEAVKKELKSDAQFVKQEALKAREETQKDVKKLKQAVNHPDDRRPDGDRDSNDSGAH